MAVPTTQSVRKAIFKSLETVLCRVYLSVDQSNLTSNAWSKINLNTIDYDNGLNYDTVAFKFTAPVTGLYQIIGSVQFTGVLATKAYGVAVYKNGVSIREVFSHSSTTDNLNASISDQLFLQQSDYIELYAKPEIGGTANTVDVLSGSKETVLLIRLVSKEGIRQ